MFSWLVMDDAQRVSLLSIGVTDDIAPRKITVSDLAGKWASPLNLLDDPKYAEWAQGLSFLPLRTLSATALF